MGLGSVEHVTSGTALVKSTRISLQEWQCKCAYSSEAGGGGLLLPWFAVEQNFILENFCLMIQMLCDTVLL